MLGIVLVKSSNLRAYKNLSYIILRLFMKKFKNKSPSLCELFDGWDQARPGYPHLRAPLTALRVENILQNKLDPYIWVILYGAFDPSDLIDHILRSPSPSITSYLDPLLGTKR